MLEKEKERGGEGERAIGLMFERARAHLQEKNNREIA